MYTKSHKRTRASAIALAVISISGAAVADSISSDTEEANWQTPVSTIGAFRRNQRTCDLEVSADAATLTGTAEEENSDGAAQLTLGVSSSQKPGNSLEVGADHAIVAYTSGNLNYCEVFDRARVTETTSLVLLKKCGWFCMRVKF